MKTANAKTIEQIRQYEKTHASLLEADAEFKHWFKERYIPIAGGWQY